MALKEYLYTQVAERRLSVADAKQYLRELSTAAGPHDIAVIAEVSDRIGVMYAGRLVELGPSGDIFHRPLHRYTQALMSAFPSVVGPKKPLNTLVGEPPNLLNPPKGCRFHPRCAFATEICREQVPAFADHGNGHFAACWHPAN